MDVIYLVQLLEDRKLRIAMGTVWNLTLDDELFLLIVPPVVPF